MLPPEEATTMSETITPTDAIREIRDRAAAGEHGVLEFPCHVNPATGATPEDVRAKVEEILGLLRIEAVVEFDGSLLAVMI